MIMSNTNSDQKASIPSRHISCIASKWLNLAGNYYIAHIWMIVYIGVYLHSIKIIFSNFSNCFTLNIKYTILLISVSIHKTETI